ncbi:MAG: hypothetical protein ACLPUG_14810 [Acidimicrobiales bacterium]
MTNLTACVPQAMVHLWALDEIDEQLATVTIGTGPGMRVELLNRLCADASGEGSDRWLLIADDDIKMPHGQLRLFIRLAQIAALDVSQPAHLARSYHSWKVNSQRLTCIARTTRFIEQGPLVLLSPRARMACLPFPESLNMGWGLEVHFAMAAAGSLQLGIIDAAGMRHLTPVAASYDREVAYEGALKVLAGAGLTSFDDLQAETRRWPIWRRRVPWTQKTS